MIKTKNDFSSRSYSIFAVDFDGTITMEDKFPNIGTPNMSVINELLHIKSLGHKIILWTSRNGAPLDRAVSYLKDNFGLEFDAVNENLPEMREFISSNYEGSESRKIFADYYIDDKMLSIYDFTH